MTRLTGWVAGIALLWTLLLSTALAAEFRIDKIDGEYVIDGWLSVAVPPPIAMAVLTDYDRMASFLPDMSESRVLSRDGERLLVRQKGVTRLGPFHFDYEVERSVDIGPDFVHSLGLRGNMKKLEMETRVEAVDSGTRIHYRAVIVPDFWVPPLIGPRAMRAQAERQFDALVAEMKRRAGR